MTANDLSLMCREIAPGLGDHLWQSTVFAGTVGMLALSLRRYQARTRYWLWLAASAKFLIPFLLLVGLGRHLGWSGHAKAGMYDALNEASQPFTEMTVRDASVSSVAATSVASYQWMALISVLLAVVWLCGLVGVMVFWWVQWRRISVVLREAEPLQEGREVEALRRVEQAAGMLKPIEVLLSRDSMEPGIFGVLRPVLLWPEGISRRLDDAQLEAVLAHEVCHVRRRDNLTSVLQMLVEAVFWFHPLVWWLEARLVEERERACDEEVLQLCGRPQVYAESILKVCEFCVESPLVCLSGVTGADLKKRIGRIMSERLGGSLSRGGRVALVALGIAAIAGPVAFGVVHGMIPVYGQILHATGSRPSFDVTTIKLLQPGRIPPFSERPDVMFTVGSIKQMIGLAYNLPPLSVAQIADGPDWIASDRYVIQGKIDDTMNLAMQKMMPAQRQQQRQLMLQSLLADRMKLKVHFETREMPMYALVVAKGGQKLHPAKEAPDSADTALPPPLAPGASPSLDGLQKGFFAIPKGAGFEMQAKALTLDELAQMLQRQSDVGGRLIVNQTGISGFYDCTMKWARQMSGTAGAPPVDSDEPTFFTAVQEQLGLRLVPTRGPAEVIVIDHVERPSEN